MEVGKDIDRKVHDLWFVFAIVIIVLIASTSLFSGLLIVTHETASPLIRISELSKSIGDGQIFVRWMPDLSRGYGYPLFNYYSPLFYYLSYPFSLMGVGLISVFNLMIILLWIVSGLGMYLFCREFFGKYGAFLCSAAYIYAPYHILDIYVRGAAAEFTSLSIFPFILWSIYKLNSTLRPKYFIFSVVSIALLALSHNIMTLFFIPLTFTYLLFLIFFNSSKKRKKLFTSLGALLLGLALSAFFWAPAVLEKDSVRISSLTEGYFNYSNHYVYPKQFINSEWGYGMSYAGEEDEMSFQIGIVHILLGLASLLAVRAIYKRSKVVGMHVGFFAITLSFSIFLATPASKFIWDIIPLLQFTQFPWRFLSIITFSISFICGGLFLLIRNQHAKIILAIVGVIIIIMVNLPFSRPDLYYVNIPNTNKITKEIISDPRVSSFAHYLGDYTPKHAKISPQNDPEEKLTILDGDAEVNYRRINSITHYFELDASTDSKFRFNEFYFSGLELIVDGENQEITEVNENGFFSFTVLEGKHIITIKYANTPLRKISIFISFLALSIILAILIFYWPRLWKKKGHNKTSKLYISIGLSISITIVVYLMMHSVISLNNKKNGFSSNSVDSIQSPSVNYSDAISLETYKRIKNEDEIKVEGDGYIYNFNLGIKYGRTGEHSKAIVEFEKALEKNPDFVPAYVNLGNAYMILDKPEQAIQSYEKVLELGVGDENSIVYLNLADAYANKMKEYKKASDFLEKYVELNPSDERIKVMLEQIQALRNMKN